VAAPEFPRDEHEPEQLPAPTALKLAIGLHTVSFASCAIGGFLLGSVLLVAGAAHHLACIGSMLLARGTGVRAQVSPGALGYLPLFLAMSVTCLLLVMRVTAQGLHGLAHAEPLDLATVSAWAAPGFGAAAAAAVAARMQRPNRPRRIPIAADTLSSAAPAILAAGMYLAAGPAESGRMDAIAGLAIVFMLLARPLLHLDQLFE